VNWAGWENRGKYPTPAPAEAKSQEPATIKSFSLIFFQYVQVRIYVFNYSTPHLYAPLPLSRFPSIPPSHSLLPIWTVCVCVCVCVCVREGGMLKWQGAFPFPAKIIAFLGFS